MSTDSQEPAEAVPTEQDRALDLALRHALRAPKVPDGFRARVMLAVLQESVRDLEARKRALDLEHAQARQRLHRSYVQMSRDTLVLIVVVAFAAGALANLALPWLQSAMAIDPAVSAPMLALVFGLCAGASVWRDRFSQ